MPLLRLGTVDYLNMRPLVDGLETALAGRAELCPAPPSRLAEWLAAGRIDVGMVPVAAVLEHPDWTFVRPAACSAFGGGPASGGGSMIGSRGPVLSLLLLGVGPPREWRRLRPDAHSLNTNALARIILERKYGVTGLQLGEPIPMENWAPPERPAPGEAMTLIGSRALRWRDWGSAVETGLTSGAVSSSERVVLDLGAEWTDWTGLPLVCAVWAARLGLDASALAELADRLEAHKLANRRCLPEIAARWEGLAHDRLTPAQALDYLTRNIAYDLDDAAMAGLARFADEARSLSNLF
jgi:predicted solute-binding protein